MHHANFFQWDGEGMAKVVGHVARDSNEAVHDRGEQPILDALDERVGKISKELHRSHNRWDTIGSGGQKSPFAGERPIKMGMEDRGPFAVKPGEKTRQTSRSIEDLASARADKRGRVGALQPRHSSHANAEPFSTISQRGDTRVRMAEKHRLPLRAVQPRQQAE
jgi:hypothetical protein